MSSRVKFVNGNVPDASASGSGLDPDISPAAAYYQAPRVARLRGRTVDEIRAFIERNTQPRTLGFLGELRVNVVALNRALARYSGAR